MSDGVQTQSQTSVTSNDADAGFGGASRFFCILGGIVAIGGGISLVGLKAASENNLFEAIAHGIGWYCIGKGLFMMAMPFQAKGAVARLLRR